MDLATGSHILLWGAVLVEALVILALARQIGLLHERIAPMGALVTDHGPQVGEPAPEFLMPTLQGEQVSIGGARSSGRSQLLLFVAPSCPVCKKVIPIARRTALTEQLDLMLIGDGDEAAQRKMVERLHIEDLPFVNSSDVGLRFRVGKLPYAILIGPDGRIASKGLVNSREHIESLTSALETGYSTIQDYLRASQGNTADKL